MLWRSTFIGQQVHGLREHISSRFLYWQQNLLTGIEALSLKVMGIMGWSAAEIRPFLEEARKDVKDTSIHAYLPM